jgi:hypothetical protein
MTEYDFITFKDNLKKLTASELSALMCETDRTVELAEQSNNFLTASAAVQRLELIEDEIYDRKIPF